MASERNLRGAQKINAADGSSISGVTQVAGDLFQTFFSAPEALRSRIRIRDFRSLITERARTFVGRDHIFSRINSLISSSKLPSGYILLRGEPGIGKTAIMCSLVNQHGYLHHFNIAPQNIRSNTAFLENICAQIIVRYQLEYSSLPNSACEDSSFLSQLLEEAASVQEEPIVIVVDAIDEAESSANEANKLLLPPTVPDGVFFVISSREQIDYRLLVDRREDIYIDDEDPSNLADISLFINQFVDGNGKELLPIIEQWSQSRQSFVSEFLERSQGNFMYVVHVLNDILEGRISPSNVENIRALPRGLKDYYRRHWRMMRDLEPDRFDQVFEPVLRFLATVREPVATSYLQELSGLEPMQIQDVILSWRQFLNETESEGEPLYRVYHVSFQDFLSAEGLGLKPYHEKIAMKALEKIPGFLDGI